MKVFLTGATGAIGKTILKKLVADGHTVTCTVRDAAKGEALTQEFGERCVFTVVDLGTDCTDQLIHQAAGHDGIIHTAFVFNDEAAVVENRIVDALLAAGSQTSSEKPCAVVISSGCLCIGSQDGPVTEATPPLNYPAMVAFRLDVEQKVIAAKTDAMSTAIVRPGWVYGGSHVDMYLTKCKESGKIPIPASNNSVLPVHVEDVADGYIQIMLRKGTGMFHSAERSVTVEEIADRIKQASGVEAVERYEEPFALVGNYSFFIFGMTLNQQMHTTRLVEDYGMVAKHNFLEFISSFYSA